MRVKQSKITHSRGQPLVDAECHLVTSVLKSIPAEIVAQRAFECRSYSRALFYWEQHIRDIRERKEVEAATVNGALERLQEIYTQIDEPDGIEGLSAHLHVLDIDQQILGHRKAGRWTAAQSWYEIKLAERPEDIEVQVNLLTCLKESGQHGWLFRLLLYFANDGIDVLLNYVEGMHASTTVVSRLLPFATEASWATGRWLALEKYTSMVPKGSVDDFNISIGKALLALHHKDTDQFSSTLQTLRKQIACSLSTATTPSLGACHDTMLRFHVLTELEMIAGIGNQNVDRGNVLESLNRRLEVLGAYLNDKQYLLGIRRAVMQLSRLVI
jgi:serine/threonine-protein kinase ATR